MHMDAADFQRIVDETITELPARFREAIKDVAIVVEGHPHPRRHRTHSFRTGGLLGLYEGTPITAWGVEYSGKLPDKISLFRENIIRHAGSPEEIPHVIRDTLLHEIAHHFGFEHDVIDRMEARWEERRERGD
jgi:predicted Zn-dependent protease with MMP-like domain